MKTMSAHRGRIRKTDGRWVVMQTRVKPEVRDAVNAAAERNGLSGALYLETLLERSKDADGNLPVFDDLLPHRDEELPITVD